MQEGLIQPDEALWEAKYAARSKKELVEGKMLYLSLPNVLVQRHVTVAEWEYMKELFRREALKELAGTGADVVVYADARFKEDDVAIESASVYIIPLSMEEFEKRKVLLDSNEQVYVVYARNERSQRP